MPPWQDTGLLQAPAHELALVLGEPEARAAPVPQGDRGPHARVTHHGHEHQRPDRHVLERGRHRPGQGRARPADAAGPHAPARPDDDGHQSQPNGHDPRASAGGAQGSR